MDAGEEVEIAAGFMEAEQDASQSKDSGVDNARDVIDHSFEELVLPEDIVDEVRTTWTTFLRSAESRKIRTETQDLGHLGALGEVLPGLGEDP